MRLFIAGPIKENSGYELEFERAESYLKSIQLYNQNIIEPVNPVTVGKRLKRYYKMNDRPEPRWPDYMRITIKKLMCCDSVFAIGDFWHSHNAMIWLRIADSIGMTIFQKREGNLVPVLLKKTW